MHTKKNWRNDNANDSNAEQINYALLDLDLTCWKILCEKFSMKSMKVNMTERKKSCGLTSDDEGIVSHDALFQKHHAISQSRQIPSWNKVVFSLAFFLLSVLVKVRKLHYFVIWHMISLICNGLRAKFPHRNIYFHCFTWSSHHKVFSDPQPGHEYSRIFGLYVEVFQMWTSFQQNEVLDIVQA